jgi:hypothetical protein
MAEYKQSSKNEDEFSRLIQELAVNELTIIPIDLVISVL